MPVAAGADEASGGPPPDEVAPAGAAAGRSWSLLMRRSVAARGTAKTAPA